MFSFSLSALGFCVISVICDEHKERERVASLIVLPPIVLGYEELYDEVPPKSDKKQTEKPALKEKPAGSKRMNLPWDQLVAYEDPRSEDAIIIPQQRLVLRRTNDGRINVQDEKETNSFPLNSKSSHEDKFKNKIPKKVVKKSITRANFQRPGKIGGLKNCRNRDCTLYKREGNEESSTKNEINEKEETTIKNENIENEETSNLNIGNEETGNKNVENEETSNITIGNEEISSKNNEKEETTIKNKIIGNEDSSLKNKDVVSINRDEHISLQGKGVISDPHNAEVLNFQGRFNLPNKLFDCPCAKNK